jgi:hypothetical protein
MITINDYLRKVQFVRDNILNETENSVARNENKIINLNVNQFENSIGTDGLMLKNKSSVFSGVYSLFTQMINPLKIAGDPYTFFDTGDFLGSFQVDMSSDLTKVLITNTGTGSGDKKSFFDGYQNKLIGLTKENAFKLNYEIIKPDLDNFIKKHL